VSTLPKISIVFITAEQRLRAQHCLDAILRQPGLERAEVLLYDLAAGILPSLEGSANPAVRVVPSDPHAGFHELHPQAVKAAKGDAIAFVDDHTVVCDGWLQALIQDFDEGYAGVGAVPSFENSGGVTDILALMHYTGFEGLSSRQLAPSLPPHNPAYRRDVLLGFGEALPDLLSCEMLLQQRIAEHGLKFLVDPAAGFVHLNIVSAYDLYQVSFLKDRAFSAARVRLSGWGMGRRLVQLAAAPLMPFIRLVKAVRHLRQADPAGLAVLRRHLGVFLISQLYAGFGLGMGTVFGAGDADRRFTQYELNRLRFDMWPAES
jgi:hypothetical protein